MTAGPYKKKRIRNKDLTQVKPINLGSDRVKQAFYGFLDNSAVRLTSIHKVRDMAMVWTGGCLCGAIRYEVSGDPVYVGHCHCSRCRRSSGAAFLTAALFPADSIEWTTQPPKLYPSSSGVDRGFCPTCGSSLTFQSPGRLLLLIGSLDRPEDIDVSESRRFEANHVFFSEKLPWVHLEDDLPRFDRFAT